MSFVYIIKNHVNTKVYIGKTSLGSIESRFKEHLNDSTKPDLQKSRILYREMSKYGKDKFYIELLEDNLTDDQACEKESYYIQLYKSYIGLNDCNGYNMTLGGDGRHWSDYELIVDTYIKNNKNESKTAQELHCSRKTIRRACKELGISMKQNSKIVRMYDLEENLLREFPCIQEAIKYFKQNGITGSDSLYRKDVIIKQDKVFKVIRE